MASPTLIAFAEKDSAQTTLANGSGETTASLTWQTGDVLVLLAIGSGAANGNTFHAPTNTGSGLAWTQKQLNASSSDTEIGAWTAVASAGSSGTVTITMQTTSNDGMQMGVYQFRAPSGSTIAVGNTALVTKKTTTQHVVGLLMTSADSSVVWGDADWAAAAVETVTPAATTHSNVSPGPSASPFSLVNATNDTGYINELDDQVSTGTINYGTTGTTGGPFAIVAVEITISGGAAAGVQPFIPLPRNTTGRGVRNLLAMRRYARTPPLLATGVTFTDAATGALIFGGTVEEGWTWAFPTQRHPRRLPITRGLRDREGLRGYTRTPSALRYTYTDTATGTWIFGTSAVEAKRGTDAGSGAWIFAGSRVEAKRGTDARSGAIIFGGTRTEAATFVQTASGALIFGGARTELKRGTDAQAGSVIFGGSRTELKRYGDTRSGSVIFGGSATQLRIGTDARTGTVIFGGHSSTVTASAGPVRVTFIIPDARGRRRRTRW